MLRSEQFDESLAKMFPEAIGSMDILPVYRGVVTQEGHIAREFFTKGWVIYQDIQPWAHIWFHDIAIYNYAQVRKSGLGIVND